MIGPLPTSLPLFFEQECIPIDPAFPNWQKSFVSGPDSPLYEVEHRIQKTNPQILVTQIQFKNKAEGPPGHVHGGASAGIIDELMGILVWHNQFLCVTQTLQLQYLKALPLLETAYGYSEIKAVREKNIDVQCVILSKEKTPYVLAQGVFHRLTKEQLQKFRTP
jgi:acyl-coenzyme A thioesterase PaaI-like protein